MLATTFPSAFLGTDDPLFCSQFGNPGTQYDWGGKTINDLDHKVKELEENQRGMKKKINPKVMNMIDKWVVFCFCSEWYSDRFLQGLKRRKPI